MSGRCSAWCWTNASAARLTRPSTCCGSAWRNTGRGWILYDGHCPLCRRLAQRARPLLEPRGFRFAPLQRQWAAARLGLVQGESPGEMVVLTRDGQVIGGADALIHLAKQVGWAKPLGWLAGVPAFRAMLRAGYRWVARHRHCSV